jgi:hypothetical protein
MAASFARFIHILSLRENASKELTASGGARGHTGKGARIQKKEDILLRHPLLQMVA